MTSLCTLRLPLPHLLPWLSQVFGKGKDALLTPDVIYAMKQGKVAACWLQQPCVLFQCIIPLLLSMRRPPSLCS